MSAALKNPDNVETVDVSRHRNLRVKANPGFVHARELHVVGITLSELAECVSNFPVVLIQRPDTGKFMPAAMLGLRSGENIYYGPEYWESTYVPMAIQRHPFLIGYDDRLPNGDEITTCLQVDSPFLNEQQGAPLFNADGSESDFLKGWHQRLNLMFESQKITDRFIDAVVALGLVSPLVVQLEQQNGEVRNIAGLFTLDEAKMKQLTTEQLKKLHEDDFLPASYILIASMHQLYRMIRQRNRQGKEQIVDFRIEFNAKPPATH